MGNEQENVLLEKLNRIEDDLKWAMDYIRTKSNPPLPDKYFEINFHHLFLPKAEK